MSPWWLRPTAEGTNEENREPNRQESRPEPPAETPSLETPSLGATPPEPAPLAEQPPISQGTEPAPEPSWRREPDRSVEELKASREREDREDETRAETAEPAFEASIADALDEGPAELQAGELEAQEEGPEEEGKAETRKKRPRRSRRGRKNGRSATASPETAEDEEDDEDREEPAHEVPAPPPLPSPRRQPAHMAVAPAPSPAPRPVRAPEPAWVPAPTTDFERLAREIIISVPERQRGTDERKIAMFCDLENIALGVRDSEIGKFDINLILERLLEKGKIIVKKAYADWERYSDYKRPFHEAAIELIDIPQKFYSGKNSADIKMVVDAMDLSYSKEHLDTFVILSGDSDFSPLVSKLKENNKYVIGVGVKNSSSNLLIDNCDEFLYYEDVWRDNQKGPKLDGLNKKTAEVFSLMIESIQALLRENKDVLWGSMIKQTMQRKKPSFNEGYYGYTTFSELLEDAERKNILKLKKDQRSGTYIVIGFASRTEPVPAARR